MSTSERRRRLRLSALRAAERMDARFKRSERLAQFSCLALKFGKFNLAARELRAQRSA